MKKIDLSTRKVPLPNIPAPNIPRFSDRNYTQGSIAASGSVLQMNAALTVQWIVCQVLAGTTIQLTVNGNPYTLPLTVPINSVVRFAGLLLPNNSILGISLSPSCTCNYEIVWVKEFNEHLIEKTTTVSFGSTSSVGTTNVNLIQQAGVTLAAPLADAPIGNEVAAVVRDIFRKRQNLITSTPLGSGATFTGPWNDTELTGTSYVQLTAVSNVASAATVGLQLQESEDQVNTRNSNGSGAASTTRTQGFVRARYWRAVYVNGATIQASFSLYSTESSMPFVGNGVPASTGTEPVAIMNSNGAAANINDGLSSASGSPILAQNGGGGLQSNAIYEFNGTTFDRLRSNWTGTTGDTGAKVATFNGATQTNFDSVGAFITILLGVVSGTTPTLSAQLQFSPDGGTTWLNLGPALPNLTASSQTGLIAIYPANFSQTPGATPANLTTGATVSVFLNCPLPRTWRIVYTIGGTTPSFAISSVQTSYQR